ncbi:MAG: hypothetical protein IPJ65_13695 [Archangiaceae bacterium]|nr:hypothetical protein [Archangiaceae bacterium]
MRTIALSLREQRRLVLVLESDVRAVKLRELPRDVPVIFAVDASTMPGDQAAFHVGVRFVLGSRARVRFFDGLKPRQFGGAFAAVGRLGAQLLERSSCMVLCVSNFGGVELGAAAVLLHVGWSQPAAITAIRGVLPDAFPDEESEVAVAVIDTARAAFSACDCL